MINNDRQVNTAIRVAFPAFPLLLRSGPSCRSNFIKKSQHTTEYASQVAMCSERRKIKTA